jgi:hypothetical protein
MQCHCGCDGGATRGRVTKRGRALAVEGAFICFPLRLLGGCLGRHDHSQATPKSKDKARIGLAARAGVFNEQACQATGERLATHASA